MMIERKMPCPICGSDAKLKKHHKAREKFYHCEVCGDYIITDFIECSFEERELQPYKHKLSAWIREKNEMGSPPPELNSHNLNLIVESLPDYTPGDKQLKLLQNLDRKTDYPGKGVNLDITTDYPLAWASNPKELAFYLECLQERGLLKLQLIRSGEAFRAQITARGWDLLEENRRRLGNTFQAFIAMSFSENMKSIFTNAIKPAVKEAGYDPYKVDMEPHSDRIDAKIITEIKNSRFLIADVTEQKRGVYFEAGYALGMGIPVIWSVRKDDLNNIHFDTRQYNHIVWETEEDLREKLYYYICAIIGKGREKASS